MPANSRYTKGKNKETPAQFKARMAKQTIESMYGGRLFSLLTETERRVNPSRRETIDNYIQSRKLETQWKDRTKRGGATAKVKARFSGPNTRSGAERRDPTKAPSNASVAAIQKILNNYSNQSKR